MLNLRRSFFLGFVAILLAFASSAWAQKTSGTIAGTVTDDSGALVAGASVTVTSVQTEATRTSQTNSAGLFSFPELNPGVYNISVTKQGFKKVEAKDIELHVSDITNVPIKLPVGAIVETVEVQASAVQVETQTGTVGNVVNGEQVRELPLNGRNFVALTTLMPGAAVAENFDPKNKGLLAGVDISFSGAPANANQWLVDGANDNDVGSQRTILVYPSIDAIEEFKILRNSYGPEFGGAGGAQINIVSKGGGNDFHASAFYFGRNDALNAKNYLLSPTDHKQLLRRNDYGYTVGGPIKKDKAFFFWSEEWNKEKRARVRLDQVPTTAELGGDYRDMAAAGCANQIPTDPLKLNGTSTFTSDDTPTGTPNVINPSRLSPAGQTYLSQLAVPNRSNPCITNWVQGVTIPVTWREEHIKGDLNITRSNVLSLSFTNDAWKNPLHSDEEGGLWGEQDYPSLSGNWSQPGKIAIAKLTTTIGTNSVNDFTFAWSANRINVTAGGDNPGLNSTIQQAFPYAFPASGKLHGNATATPLGWGGGPSGIIGHFGPWNNAQDLFTWKDDFSRVVGRHSVKIGALYGTNKKDEETGGEYGQLWGGANGTGAGFMNPANGSSTTNWGGGTGAATGTEYGDYLLKGALFGYGENVRDGTAQARWHDMELYAGDSWKARPRLTLEYGVRYSLTPPVYDAANRYSTFDPAFYDPTLGGKACNGIVLPKGATNTCPTGTGGTIGKYRGLVPTNYHAFAPRVGFAWDVLGNGKFALRGGVGQFFARDPISILVQIEGVNTPFAIAAGGLRTLDGPLCTASATPYGPCSTSGPDATLQFWGNGGLPASGLAKNDHLANNWQWNLTTETALWKNAKLELGWVALRGIHLNSSRNLNQIAPANRIAFIDAGITGGNQNQYYPYGALFGSQQKALGQFGDFGDSVYHSLQATFQTRVSRNSQFQTSYTWSHNISDTTLEYIGPGNGIADTYNPRAGRGNADFDRRHVLNANLVYNLPLLQGSNGFVKGTLGGWESSAIANYYTGAAVRVQGSVSGICDMDVVTNSSGTTNDCAPGTGMHKLVGGNPWGVGQGASGSQSPNRDLSQPCHVSSSNRTQWLNPAAFTWTGFKLAGHTAPGACSGPAVADVDFSILKNWGMPFHGSRLFGEKSKIQFRMEFFNLLNHPMFRNTNSSFSQTGPVPTAVNNFGATGATITNSVIDCRQCTLSSGSIFGVAKTPSNIGNREIQYALKLIF